MKHITFDNKFISVCKGLYSGQSHLQQKGSALIASLLAAGLIGISSITLVSYIRGFQDQVQSFEFDSDSFNIHSEILSNIQALLIKANIDDKGNEQDQSTWGVCSLLEQPNKVSGVELIQFNLSLNLKKRARGSFLSKRWSKFFPKSRYILSSNKAPCRSMDSSFRSNYFSRCFKYIGKESKTANEIYIITRIIPKKFPSFTVMDLSSDNVLDVKTVVFELQSHIAVFEGKSYNRGNILSSSKQYEVIWSNSVSECHVQSANGNWVVVQFSGSGPGRLSSNTLINSAEFGDVNICSDLEFQDIPSHLRVAYQISSDGETVASDHSKNVRLACRRKIYRCPGVVEATDNFDSFNFNFGLSNDSGGSLNLKNINLTFTDSSSTEADSTDNGKIDNLKVKVFDRVNDFDGNTVLTNKTLRPGQSIFKLTVTDKNAGSLKGFCDGICAGNNYFPLIKIGLKKPSGATCTSYSSEYHKEDKYRVRCIVCHSKICYEKKLGAFGPIRDDDGVQGLVDEPLDGTIPECALKKTSVDYDLPSVSSGSGDCVAMKATSLDKFKNFSTSTAQYEFRNCTESLPVLCFAYGHYLPAMSLSTPGTKPSIFTGSFAQAQEACYKMGRELIEKEELAGYLGNTFGNTVASVLSTLTTLGLPFLTVDSNYFDYVNIASRGIFTVPSYNISAISNRLSQGSESYLQKFVSSSHNKLWVAMEKDNGGQLIGSIPQATVATSAFSVFTRKELPSAPVILKNTNSISDTGADTVLTHNIQYKGVYNVSGSGSNQVLCRRGAGDFILASNTSLANAPQACRDLGAAFLPPVSSMEWVKAMNLLNPNDELYPFPTPGDFSGDSYSHSLSVNAPRAWVALTKNGSGSSAKDWRLSKAYFPDSDSIFKTEVIPNVGAGWIGIIDYKGKPVMPTMDVNTFSNLDLSVYKKACFTDEGNGQVVLKSSVSADKSCDSGQTAVTKDKLKVKSIRFMADWVEKNTSGEFIIDGTLIQQAVTQARKKTCRDQCDSAKASCDSDCNSDYSNCTLPCTTTTTTPPPPGAPPGTPPTVVTDVNQSCIDACSNTRNSCSNSCSSDLASCNSTCDSNNDISGHAHVWFP